MQPLLKKGRNIFEVSATRLNLLTDEYFPTDIFPYRGADEGLLLLAEYLVDLYNMPLRLSAASMPLKRYDSRSLAFYTGMNSFSFTNEKSKNLIAMLNHDFSVDRVVINPDADPSECLEELEGWLNISITKLATRNDAEIWEVYTTNEIDTYARYDKFIPVPYFILNGELMLTFRKQVRSTINVAFNSMPSYIEIPNNIVHFADVATLQFEVPEEYRAVDSVNMSGTPTVLYIPKIGNPLERMLVEIKPHVR